MIRTLRAALLAAGLLPLFALAAAAQNGGSAHPVPPPSTTAVPREGAVRLDGVLDEAFWAAAAAPATDFRQIDPNEGRPATQRTEVRFAYDDAALYVGARMYDSLGAAGVRTRLARRDQSVEGDYLFLVFDTFHDHVGRTEIRVNPSGVKYDAGQASSFADPSWDPVWQAATRVDSAGWTAELRIPFSQLRFSRDSVQSWGVQVQRYVERLNETSAWAFWTKQEAGGPQRYGHLEGVRITGRARGFELLPYAVSRASYVHPTDDEDPFQDYRDYDWRVGADVKALLGSNLTLSATVNPDFGQVEVDPAVVNLSAFETFFSERRPFFVEGSGLLGFGSFSCFTCSNVSSLSLFYSRRIGRRPQGSIPFDTDYVDVPDNTAILGAAKVTGRLSNGLEVGVLEALTRSETARVVDAGGERLTREVEPLTNYFLGRARQTWRGGNVTVGGIVTSVARSFAYDSLRQQIPAHAEAVGVDWNVYWKNRAYRLMGNLALSSVAGDSAAIGRLQRSSAHYFHRPDRDDHSNGLFTDAHDPDATSLRGYGGYLRLAREAGSWRWEGQVNYRSPGFAVNDMAFNSRSDYVWMLANLNRRWTTPTRYFRSASITLGGQQQYNYDGDTNDRQVHLSLFGTLHNYWNTGLYTQHRPRVFEDRLTRSGPVVRRPASSYVGWNLSTDSRKQVVLATAPSYGWNEEGGWSYFVNLDVRLKPASNIQLSFSPYFERVESVNGFVDRWDDATATHFMGHRVVFAQLSQRTLSMDTRLNLTFTPDLSLEVYAQPFVSTGEYRGFKEFTAPRTLEKRRFDAAQLTPVLDADGRVAEYELDPDRDGDADFTFSNPDFNTVSLRGNAVLRWEYRPGSTLFFVWQQQRRDGEDYGDFRFGRDAPGVFRSVPDNVFVIKASYWLGR